MRVMKLSVGVLAITAAYVAAVYYFQGKYGSRSIMFAVLANWLTCCWWAGIGYGLDWRFPLPEVCHRPRSVERQGAIYKWFGVRFFKWLLSRGPLGFFSARFAFTRRNELARIEQETRYSEAAHWLIFLVSLAYPVYSVARGWPGTAFWFVLFNVLLHAPCIMLQRHNRPRIAALLASQ